MKENYTRVLQVQALKKKYLKKIIKKIKKLKNKYEI